MLHKRTIEVAPNRAMSRRAVDESREGRRHSGATERQGTGQVSSARGARPVLGQGMLVQTGVCEGATKLVKRFVQTREQAQPISVWMWVGTGVRQRER